MNEKHAIMGLDSIKFRQQIEINYGKKMSKKEKGVSIIAYMCQ